MKEYIGGGVWLEVKNGHLVLSQEAGGELGREHFVVIEPDMLGTIKDFAIRNGLLRQKEVPA